MASSSKPHALLVPLPFQGDMNPFLELAKKLLSAGFLVTLANTQANHRRIINFFDQHETCNGKATSEHDGRTPNDRGRDEVLPTDRYVEVLLQDESKSEHLRLVSLEDGLPATFETVQATLHSTISPAMKAAVEALVFRLLQEKNPVSCLVADLRLVYVHDIGDKLGIPRMAFWVQSAANLISHLMLAQGLQAPPDDSTLITTIPTLPPHRRSEVSALFTERLSGPPVSDEYLWEPYLRIKEAKWVTLNTYEELESATLDALQEIMGFRPLAFGPLVGTPIFTIVDGITECVGEQEDASMKWLQAHPPASVLYIAFGSLVTLTKQQLEELVIGLEASQQPFLWVFRPDLCRELGDVAVGSIIERIKDQGMIVPWAQQWQVLCHPSIGGFLTHCGWNSTLEGIKAGVPMLGWPQFSDQIMNSRFIEDKWGNGLRLKAHDLSGRLVLRAEVENKVRKLMQGESGRQLREKASALRVAAKGALADGGSSSLNLEVFFKDSRKR